MSQYVDALIDEVALRKSEHEDFSRPSTLYIGGGTPSILPICHMNKLIDGISEITDLSAIKEFTVEVNPEDVTSELIECYRKLGVNRVSMGIQSFDDKSLTEINRRHNSETARKAISILKESEINYSVDIIFGLPSQSTEDWRRSVDEVLSVNPPHFSAYLLSYEPGTRLYAKLMAGKIEETNESIANEMYEYVILAAKAAGYEHYEISNYSLPGKYSIHNASYWNYTPYLGIGASAHSFDGETRRYNPPNIQKYIKAILSGNPFYEIDYETVSSQFNDMLITALRTKNGLDINDAICRFGSPLVNEMLADAVRLVQSGKLIRSGNAITIPENEWLRSDAILRELIRI